MTEENKLYTPINHMQSCYVILICLYLDIYFTNKLLNYPSKSGSLGVVSRQKVAFCPLFRAVLWLWFVQALSIHLSTHLHFRQ